MTPTERHKRWAQANKTHLRAYARRWRAANPDKVREYNKDHRHWYCPVKARAKALRRKFGMTVAQLEQMRAAQGNRCAICATGVPGGKGDWHVDHDHKTNRIRGLLCQNCNIGLGNFKDSPIFMGAAINYLRKSAVAGYTCFDNNERVRMNTHISIELESVDEAIVALGAVAQARLKAGAAGKTDKGSPAGPALTPAAPAAEEGKARRGRSDKGQARGPNARTQDAAPEKAPADADKVSSGPTPAPAAAPAAATEVAGAVAATAAAPAETASIAAPEASEADVQAAIGKLFATDKGTQKCIDVLSRFGVGKVRELKPEQRAKVVEMVEAVLKGEAI